jgi:hypothetical protein
MASFQERVIGAIKLDPRTYEEVEADQSAMSQAMTVVVLSALAAGVGTLGLGLRYTVLAVIGALIGWFIWAGLTYLIGTKVMAEPQTHADFGQLLRTIGFSSAPGLLKIVGIIPFIGWIVVLLAGLWQLAAMVVAVRQALDYTSTGRAVAVCVIGFVAQMVVIFLIMGVLIGGVMAISGGGSPATVTP